MRKLISFSGALILLVTTQITLAQSSSARLPRQKKTSHKASAASASSSAASAAGNVSTTVSSPSTALENVSVSEYAMIPSAGRTALTAKAQYVNRNITYQYRLAGSKQKDYETRRGLMVVPRFDHGFEGGWSLGGEVGAALGAMTETRQGMKDSDSTGLTDLTITLKKVKDLSIAQLFFGGQLTLSPGERVWATPKENGNLYTGGPSFSGFVGLQKDFRTHILGGQVRHDVFMDRSESYKTDGNQKVNVSKTNGNIFSFDTFLEKPTNNKVFGAQLGISLIQPTDYTYSVSGTNTRFNLSSNQYNTVNLGAYARLQLKEIGHVELLPSVNYSKVLSYSGGTYSIEEATENSTVTVAARWPL